MELRELKKSNIEYFKLNQFSNTVWFINHYNREDKTYSISKFEDINAERFIKGTTQVFIDFDF
tara:strand:+ start:1519 stop:1707 length:189 start_codon:yes stop_codon:yes gene_type:complete